MNGRTSAASVIHALFQALSSSHHGNHPFHERWRQALGLPAEVSVYWSLEQAVRLVTTARAQMELLGEDRRRTKAHAREVLDHLASALEPQMLHRPWTDFASTVTADRLARLDMVAEVFDAQFPEGCPGEGVVPDLLARIDAVTEALDGVPYPAHVRKAIEGRIAALRWAVENWHLVGSAGVADLMGAMGSAVSVGTANAVPQGGPEAKRVQDAVVSAMDWIGRCMLVHDGASAAIKVGMDLQRLLSPGQT